MVAFVSDHQTRAARYRMRAEECRRLAALTSGPIGAEYESIARDYDELALLESLLAANQGTKAA